MSPSSRGAGKVTESPRRPSSLPQPTRPENTTQDVWPAEGVMAGWVSWGCLLKTGDWVKGREGHEEGNEAAFATHPAVAPKKLSLSNHWHRER